MLENVRDYLLNCPLLSKDTRVDIEYLNNEPNNYAIEEGTGYNPILENYLDGSSRRQFLFGLTSREYYGQNDIDTNLSNSKFYDNFYNWLEKNTYNGIFPKSDEDTVVESIKAISNGYLFSVDEGMTKARYRIQCQLIYEKKGNDL